jgi:hypothetical protein
VGIRVLPILLSVLAAALSGFIAYVQWLGASKTDVARLQAAVAWERRMGFSWAKHAMALAELEPSREREWLALAAEDRDAAPAALIRLSMIDEMAGDQRGSVAWMKRALARSKTYKTFLAAASQAKRRSDEEGVLRWGGEALRYCPGEADAVFHLLAAVPRGADVLRQAETRRRVDYLRYLIGQERYLEALEYQGELPNSELVASYRRELAERLILNQRWEEAVRLHPDPVRGGLQNSRFEAEPTSLAYDWRLAKHEALLVEWSPGRLSMRLGKLDAPKELMSQYVKHSGPELPRLEPRWQGTVRGLEWRRERLHPEWVRVSLVAAADEAKEFAIEEVTVTNTGIKHGG